MPFPTKRYTFTHESQCPQLQSTKLTPEARRHVVDALGLLDSTALVIAELAQSYEEHPTGTVCARFVGSQGVQLIVYAGPAPLQATEPAEEPAAPTAGDGQLNLTDLSEPTVPESDETLLAAARAELEDAAAALRSANEALATAKADAARYLAERDELARQLIETREERDLLQDRLTSPKVAPNDV